MSFKQNYSDFLPEFMRVCEEAQRDPRSVRILPVSKTVDAAVIEEAITCGFNEFGENRPDVLLEKYQILQATHPSLGWHFIGNIQSRRIPDIVACSSLIHSLYKWDHVEKIDKAAKQLGKIQEVLLEVNVSGEESKGGLAPHELPDMLHHVLSFEHIRLKGLMTMAPKGDEECARETFLQTKELFELTKSKMNPLEASCFNEISMGMSDDWVYAVQSGATIIRIGRTLFRAY